MDSKLKIRKIQPINEFATILAEKQNLIELGYHHVQLLREEIDAVRAELERVRHSAKLDLEAARNAARLELEASKNTARAELKSQQDAASVELETVKNAANAAVGAAWDVRVI